MQHALTGIGGAALLLAGFFVGNGFQDDKKPPATESASPPGMPKPGPEHQWLASQEGTWKATTRMMDPATGAMCDPIEGKEVVRTALGGLWQISDFELPKSPLGAGFKGHGVMGFDPGRKKFVGSWFDSWSTSPTLMEGVLSEDKKTFTVTAIGVDPSTGGDMPMKQVVKIVDEKRRTFAMSMPGPDGSEITTLVIEYEKQ
jgi:hypothetical protein